MQTLQLIAQAEATGEPLATISRALGVNPAALHQAKARGRLSPGLAAALAAYLGQPPSRWTMAAVIEGERSAPLRRRLATLMRGISYVTTRYRLRSSCAPMSFART